MTDPSIIDLIAEIETTLPEWDWLLTSKKKEGQGYFANIMSPDHGGGVWYVDGNKIDLSTGRSFCAYGDTPREALTDALAQVPQEFKDHDSLSTHS
jgi:hypothetical protein